MKENLSSKSEPENEDQRTGDENQVDGGNPLAEQERESEQQDLPKDVVFGLLSAKRRRDVLAYMAEHGPTTTLSDLADHIAAEENDTEIRLLNSQQRKRVYVALYQCHLPRMDEADVIDFERGRGTVELRPNAAQLYQYLAVSPGDDSEADTQEARSLSDRVTGVRRTMEEWVPKSI